jgi:hypothetical protein
MYSISQAASPPAQKFIDPINERYLTLAPYDEIYFKLLFDTFTYEQVRTQDRDIMGFLASLGIERGEPYNPDDLSKRAMRQTAIDGRALAFFCWTMVVPAKVSDRPATYYLLAMAEN